MRKLNTGDVFKVARIMKVANLKQPIKEMVSAWRNSTQADTEADVDVPAKDEMVDNIGVEVVFVLVEAIANEKAEGLVYELLAGISGQTVEEIKGQEFGETMSLITRIINENDISVFFKSAASVI